MIYHMIKYCLFALWNTERIIDLYNLIVQKYGFGDINEIKFLMSFLMYKKQIVLLQKNYLLYVKKVPF